MSPAHQENRFQRAVSEGSVAADSTAAAAVLRAANQLAKSTEITDRELHRLQLVAEELVTNIVTHGVPPAGSRIGFRFERTVESMRIEITDRGAPFDPRSQIQPSNSVRSHSEEEGGVGWPLILRWCRIADYGREAGENRVVLIMPLARPASS
jgi:anti-sigma regulatory factor (Ser/Thr protein kinase)